MRWFVRGAVALFGFASLTACAGAAARSAPNEPSNPNDGPAAATTEELARPPGWSAAPSAVPNTEVETKSNAENDARARRCAESRPKLAAMTLHDAELPDSGTLDPIPGGVRTRIPPETIQRVVRANFDSFRTCYESGLRRNPKLHGRVAVAFVIDECGDVVKAQDNRSDLPDAEVVACVQQGFARLRFPPPTGGGIVTVVYPIIFNPGD